MGDRDRQHAVLAFHRHQLVDEAAHRFAAGVHDRDELAIEHAARRPDATLGLGHAQVDQLIGAVQDVGMGVFLVADDEVGGFHHGRGQMAVRIQFRADHRVRADDLARAAQQVALAIVVAVGHHRAVQAEQRHVHGAGVAQVLQQLVAQRFIGVASGDAGRHGGGGQAFDQRPVLPLARCRAAHSGPAYICMRSGCWPAG